MDIRVDDLSRPEISRLLQEHLRCMALHSPPESIHALDLAALRATSTSASDSSRADHSVSTKKTRTAHS